ncbi:hypothetical protein BDP27DRAFT_1226800, partial [Rhodocollybia butyracea]
SNIMRDNHLIKVSNTFMAVDLNIEHHIGYIKELYAEKGIYAVWDHLANISAAVVHTNACKKKARKMMKTSYQKKNHTAVDTNKLVWEVVEAIQREKLLEYNIERKTDFPVKPVVDLQVDGYTKLKATITGFNKRTQAFWSGEQIPPEEDDELATMQWASEADSDAIITVEQFLDIHNDGDL